MRIRPATPADATPLFAIVNAAYHAESGDVPPAFKTTTRFLEPAELLPPLAAGTVLLAECPTSGAPLGCLAYSLERAHPAAPLRAHFGPFAVAPSSQGAGVGKALLAALEVAARAAGAASLDAEVVNHRLDILPMYLGKLGFRVVGDGAFPAPERCSRPCHFICIRRAL